MLQIPIVLCTNSNPVCPFFTYQTIWIMRHIKFTFCGFPYAPTAQLRNDGESGRGKFEYCPGGCRCTARCTPGRLPLHRSLDVTTSAASAVAASKEAHDPACHFVRCKTPITTGSLSRAVRSWDLHPRGCGFEPRLLLPPLMTLLHDFYD